MMLLMGSWFPVMAQTALQQAEQIKSLAEEALFDRKWKEAELKAYEASEIFAGENQIPNYLECLLIALEAHVQQNETDAAKRGYRKVAEMSDEHLGSGSEVNVKALSQLANLYAREGDEANALDIRLKILSSAEGRLGKKHPLMRQNYQWLEQFYLKQGKNREAKEMQQKQR